MIVMICINNWYLFAIVAFWLVGCSSGDKGPQFTNGDIPQLTSDKSVCDNPVKQNQILLDYLKDWYLWADEIPTTFSGDEYSNVHSLLEAVRSSNSYDRWSDIVDLNTYEAMFSNTQAVSYGWLLGANDTKTELKVLDVQPNSIAAEAGLTRGDIITHIDGQEVSHLSELQLFEVMYPSIDALSDQVEVLWQSLNGEVSTALLGPELYSFKSVRFQQVINTPNKTVGYLVYLLFDQASDLALAEVFGGFKAQGVDTLILDLRYNPGGLGDIANRLAVHIAGDQLTGQVFNQLQFNAKHKNQQRELFFHTDLIPSEQMLNLSSLVVLTSRYTASASELLINSLAPYVSIMQIGETTAGKPVGMKVVGICDHVVMAVTQKNVNALGWGDFFEGIAPQCQINDEVNAAFGEEDDHVLQTALSWLESGVCVN